MFDFSLTVASHRAFMPRMLAIAYDKVMVDQGGLNLASQFPRALPGGGMN
jgi:hypothetical protein